MHSIWALIYYSLSTEQSSNHLYWHPRHESAHKSNICRGEQIRLRQLRRLYSKVGHKLSTSNMLSNWFPDLQKVKLTKGKVNTVIWAVAKWKKYADMIAKLVKAMEVDEMLGKLQVIMKALGTQMLSKCISKGLFLVLICDTWLMSPLKSNRILRLIFCTC